MDLDLRNRKLEGEFKKHLTNSELEGLFGIDNFELLGPSLRASDLFYVYLDTLICLQQKAKSVFVLGDIYFLKSLATKDQSVRREAAFSNLFFWCAERDFSLIGYYLKLPLLNKNFYSPKIGESFSIDLPYLEQDTLRKEHFKRSKSLLERNSLVFQELNYSDHQELHHQFFNHFIKSKSYPKIEFLLSTKENLNELSRYKRMFVFKDGEEVVTILSGFQYSNGFYVDLVMSKPSAKQKSLNSQILLNLSRLLEAEGFKWSYLGLCPYVNLESDSPIGLRLLKKFKLHYNWEKLQLFKSRNSNRNDPRFLLLDRRKNSSLQLYKLAKNSLNFRI
ncbi:MAG: hypothetical protein AB8E15_11815 [Bdellovibrionales bacterium]